MRARDVVDWIDWFANQERYVVELRRSILDGSYAPSPPTRYKSAKAKGSFRTITVPSIRDTVVYRHISDEALRRGLSGKVVGAFFSRRHSKTPVGPTFEFASDADYQKFFTVWKAYNQYRTHTLLNAPHDVLVVTDISNFFDSIQHELLLEYLAPLGLPRKSIGLLGRILESFKPRAGHSPNPRVGIPVDELDCSRQLAHLFLFEHDRRVTGIVGEDKYVRWMDDQNVGAASLTDARRVVNLLTGSLASQLLTLNSGKTRFLTPSQVVDHFQLEANRLLDNWSDRWGYPARPVNPAARNELRKAWRQIQTLPSVGMGYWEKVLKRVYGLAVHVDIPDLEGRTYDDLVEYPDLDERIFIYLARRSRPRALIELFRRYVAARENLFEATENSFFEAVLLLNPSGAELRDLRSLARSHSGSLGRRRALPRASAVLAMYWLGCNADEISRLYSPAEAPLLPKEVARAWLATVFALDPSKIAAVQRALLGHPSDDVARLARFLTDLESGDVVRVGSLPAKRHRWPLPGKELDARAWLILEILSHAGSPVVRARVRSALPGWRAVINSSRESRIADRIAVRVT